METAGYPKVRRLDAARWGVAPLVALLLHAGPPAIAASRPATIPALQQVTPTAGTWQPRRDVRVVVRRRDREALVGEARRLARDLGAVLGRPIAVTARRGARARRGDVLVGRSSPSGRLGSEGYALRIGRAFSILAPTSAGAFYGGRTLLQLLRGRQPIARGRAEDWPRYPERGLMLLLADVDSPLEWLKGYVRELSYLKLNLLHLRLNGPTWWALESESHPELPTPGALTRGELRELLTFARAHHVEIVPEINVPSRAEVIVAEHPELELKYAGAFASQSGPFPRRLDISNPAARELVRDVLEEYLPLFPGRYWHMGGDEYMTPLAYPLYPQLLRDAQARYGPSATVEDEINGFFNWIDDIVRAHGKTTRAWSDQFTAGNVVPINEEIVAEWWTELSPLSHPLTRTPKQLLADGHRIVNAGWYPTYYADDLGPVEGMPEPAEGYEGWAVDRYCGAKTAGVHLIPCERVDPDEQRNLGSKVNVWKGGDDELAEPLFPRLRVIAQKTWSSPPLTPSYERFAEIMRMLGRAPVSGRGR